MTGDTKGGKGVLKMFASSFKQIKFNESKSIKTSARQDKIALRHRHGQ